ncbi:MAG: glycosyltransferase [Motiliproteus sp.]
MKKINVLLINYSLGVGGIEKLLLEFCKNSHKNHTEYKFHIVVFSSLKGIEEEFSKYDVNIISLNKKHGIDFELISKLTKVIEDLNIDIVHSHAQNTWLYGVLASRKTKKPIISTIHSGTYKYGFVKRFRWDLLSFLLSIYTDKIITVGMHLRQDLLRVGVRKKKVVSIHNGVNVEDFSGEHTADVENSLIIVARLCFQKNHMLLFEAINIVMRVIPDIKLYVVGDGELRNILEEYIAENKLEDNIFMLGRRDDISNLLNKKSIFVLPSIIEGLPVSLLEAMSSKKAIIASDIPANREVVSDNRSALFVDPKSSADIANKIIKLYKDKDLQEKLSSQAFIDVKKNFSFDVMTERYIDLYRDVLS